MPELGPQVQRAPPALVHGGSMLQSSPVATPGAQAPRHSHMLGFPNAGQRQLSPSPFTHLPSNGVQGSPACAPSQPGEPPAPAAPPLAAPPFTAPLTPPPPVAEPPVAEPPVPPAEPPLAPANPPVAVPLAAAEVVPLAPAAPD